MNAAEIKTEIVEAVTPNEAVGCNDGIAGDRPLKGLCHRQNAPATDRPVGRDGAFQRGRILGRSEALQI